MDHNTSLSSVCLSCRLTPGRKKELVAFILTVKWGVLFTNCVGYDIDEKLQDLSFLCIDVLGDKNIRELGLDTMCELHEQMDEFDGRLFDEQPSEREIAEMDKVHEAKKTESIPSLLIAILKSPYAPVRRNLPNSLRQFIGKS